MEYRNLSASAKFLASFNNESNGFAKVISVSGDVVLGYIGRFGYSVFELNANGFYEDVIPFGSLSVAKREFKERADQSGMMPLSQKASLIKDAETMEFVKSSVSALKAARASFDKIKSISASVKLSALSKMTVGQIEKAATEKLKTLK
jgi:hypothetical protein